MGCTRKDWTYGKFLDILFGTTNLELNIKMAGALLLEQRALKGTGHGARAGEPHTLRERHQVYKEPSLRAGHGGGGVEVWLADAISFSFSYSLKNKPTTKQAKHQRASFPVANARL